MKILFLFILIITFQPEVFAQSCGGDWPGTYQSDSGVKTVARIKITLNGKEGGKVDSCEIAAWDSLVITNSLSCATDSMNAIVHSYKCIVQQKSGARMFYLKGPKLSSDLKAALSRCRNGDLIIFYDIQVSGIKSSVKMNGNGPLFRVQE